MDYSGNQLLVPEPEDDANRLPGPATPEASPYAVFGLSDKEMQPKPQLQALMDDPEIAGYLQDNNPKAWTRQRLYKAGIGFAVAAVGLMLLFFFAPGNLFRTYTPPPPRDTPKPQAFADTAELPILFRDSIREINAEIDNGNRWQTAFDKLRAFLAEATHRKINPPNNLLLWAHQEMLVILASKEIPPGAYPLSYPDEVFDEFKTLVADTPDPMPFRGGSAYARILISRPEPKEKEEAAAWREKATDVLESLRAAHPTVLDNNRELLAMEAEAHIRQFPKEYVEGDQYLDYHWRRAAHAIVRLYELYGSRDPAVRQIDRRRWQAVYRYFDLTLLTWDPTRIGRLKSIRLDGNEYTRVMIKQELDRL